MAFTANGDGSGITSNGVNLQVGLYADENSTINLSSDLFSDASLAGIFTDLPDSDNSAKSLADLITTAGGTIADLASTDADAKQAAIEAFAAACCGLKYVDDTTMYLQADPDNGAKEMLAYLDAGIDELSGRVTEIGAAQNRVESALTSLDVQSQNITSSLSTLRDTDVAEESSNYIQAQILQQASATLLSTANQLPSIALNLI